MIDVFDEVLRTVLVDDVPVRNGEIDISFHQPKREWSARVTRPTLNVFLYDVRENNTLRQWGAVNTERGENGQYRREFAPRRVDLHYVVTAWSTEPDDEHRLLAAALLALLRHPELPNRRLTRERLPERLQSQPMPIPLKVAQPELLKSPADLWSAMDNELRPAISLVATVAFDPNEIETGPLVRSRGVAIGPASGLPDRVRLDKVETTGTAGTADAAGTADLADRLWLIGGTVRTGKAGERLPDGVRVTLVERGETFAVDADGRFRIGRLGAGTYTLIVEVPGHPPIRRVVEVGGRSPMEIVDIVI